MREIWCDESGYEGEKLIDSTTPLFAHAAVQLDEAVAAELLLELRSRIRSPASAYRAGHLLREKNRAVLRWFLAESPVRGHGTVFVLDKTEWVATRLAELLDVPPDKIDRSPYVLAAGNDLLRGKDQPGVVDEFFRVSGLTVGRERAELFRAWLLTDPGLNSVLDPLVPALEAAAKHWGPVAVLHDRQIMLPERRVEQLRARTGGLIASIRLLPLEEHPRIQLADMLAGTVRWIVEHPDDAGLHALAPPYLL
ncbi:DUF3800 domain-containing protein [Symbioplanes lichenis]|uniref:DUF3800 domain-containing protein n=1 Tax=Symbioplanes lichenis TaxID=1629072 RepID=UPI002738B15A|nr:DUF3800 domain-containing protein [Actinoplanes lichenis]